MALLRFLAASLCHSSESKLQKGRGIEVVTPGNGQGRDDGGLDHAGSCGGGKTWRESGFLLKITTNVFGDDFNVEQERKGLKVSERFWLSKWKDRVALN